MVCAPVAGNGANLRQRQSELAWRNPDASKWHSRGERGGDSTPLHGPDLFLSQGFAVPRHFPVFWHEIKFVLGCPAVGADLSYVAIFN